jgi:hypothetical protein
MMEEERTLCAVCAARLDGQQALAWLALAMTASGVIVMALDRPGFWWDMVVLAGLAERYVAARLVVDARLFAQMSRAGPDLPRLDAALQELRMAAPAAPARSLQSRIQGAMKWTRRHTILVLGQAVLAAVALGGK